MKKLCLKNKSILALIIISGVLVFSIGHASELHSGMGQLDCHAQTFCGNCPVLIPTSSTYMNNFLTQTEVNTQTPAYLPDPCKDSLYHPPK
jgi:hypothetical protein